MLFLSDVQETVMLPLIRHPAILLNEKKPHYYFKKNDENISLSKEEVLKFGYFEFCF